MATGIVVTLPTTVGQLARRLSGTVAPKLWAMVAHADPNLIAGAARPESVVPQRYVSFICDGHG